MAATTAMWWRIKRRWFARSVALLALLAPLAGTATPDGEPASDDVVKMAIVYNLGKFVDWPGETTGPFTLCVLGHDDRLRAGLAAIASRPVRGRELRVRRLDGDYQFDGCQILFFSETEPGRLASALASAHSLGVLTVSDVEHFVTSGGAVELITHDHRVRFAVNLEAAQAANLHVSSELLRLAQTVTGAQRP